MQIDMFETWYPSRPRRAALTFPFALRGRAVAAMAAAPQSGAAPFVESIEYDAAMAYAHLWQGLAARALEENVFAEPACALAAAQHFAGAHRPRFLFVWSGGATGGRGDLLAVCPKHVPGRLESRRLAWTWTHEHAPLGTPLFDKRRAATALEAILAYVGREMPTTVGLVFRDLPLQGPTTALLQDWARDRGVSCELMAPRCSSPARPRNVIPLAGPAESIVATFGRRRQALEGLGTVTFRTLRQPSDVRFATEEFFLLDAAARRGRPDAVLSRSDMTTFVRALTRVLAAAGSCRIDRLAVNDRPVAISIVISAPNRDYVWKIATDADLACYGIEGQLMLAHLRAHPDAPVPALADARDAPDCGKGVAGPWMQALPMVDVALALAVERNRAFAAARRNSVAWRTARALLGRG